MILVVLFLLFLHFFQNNQKTIKNINVNASRTGCLNILNKMDAKIKIKIKKNIKEKKLQIFCQLVKNNLLKAINCPSFKYKMLLMNF